MEFARGLGEDITVDEFNARLADLGVIIGEGREFQKFWNLSMTMLEEELEKVFAELNNELNKIDSRKNDNCTIDSNPKEYINRLNAFKDAVSKISWTDTDITLSPTQFFNKFFANCVDARTLGFGDWREIYEHIGPSQQCAGAQKNLNEVIDWDICYICGQIIEDKKKPKIHDPRECEHILPAFTALGFKGLIQSTKQETFDNIPSKCLEFFRYEYANSHRCCNRIKSGDKFIKYDFESKRYDLDTKTLETTLEKIRVSRTGLHDCGTVTQVEAPALLALPTGHCLHGIDVPSL